MKIQYCSDLHLEFEHNSRYLENHPLPVSGDVLILAGDIVPIHDEHLNHPFFKSIAGKYERIFWVPGNHEFYHKDLSGFSKSYQIDLGNNFSIVNNVELEYGDVRFIFSTLWSHISPDNAKTIEQGVSDFDCISHKNKRMRAVDFNALHRDGFAFIQQALQKKRKKTVVVTHHLPSEQCNSPEHNFSPINEAFCVDLTSYIEDCGASFWIYGHSHFNQKPLIIGETMLLTNQLGYVQANEHSTFRKNAFIVV